MSGSRTRADLPAEEPAAIQRLPATAAERIRRWVVWEEAWCAVSFVLYVLIVCVPV
jgi:uncharacterized membrane protein YdjX (TVP38/TMEM64 family)